jgi:hypothetical protein
VDQSDVLLGFDARVAWPDESWDDKRKKAHLFRLDVLAPLSIDSTVWPSIFGRHSRLRPHYVGPHGFWDDLAKLRGQTDIPRTRRIAAFAVAAGACTQEERRALDAFLRGVSPDGAPGLTIPGTDPPVVKADWSFLGYDVADLGGGTSGLMNCGFVPEQEDVDALRLRWGPKLNGFHLFHSLGDAREFKGLSNRRVAEHAPFFVHGIWLVDGDRATS